MGILRVFSLYLPETLPHPKVIRSWGDNLHSYEPEFWELQYHIHRYLEKVSDELLIERYIDICRNMRALISRERDVIPIQSFLSSWYWYRKEHQTRLEFSLRNKLLPVQLSNDITFGNQAINSPIGPSHPNAGDVLFRYDKTHQIENLFNNGQIRIRPASDFLRLEQDIARKDEECSKKLFLEISRTRITTEAGTEIPFVGCIEKTVSLPDYYVFCMACDWDPELFADFDVDSCLIIKDTESFSHLIENAAKIQLSDWFFHHNPVEYFDPYERHKNEHIDAAMSKNFKFAYQREYRFLWMPKNGDVPDGFKFLELGSLGHLAEVCSINH